MRFLSPICTCITATVRARDGGVIVVATTIFLGDHEPLVRTLTAKAI
jgi:hypothetical protein